MTSLNDLRRSIDELYDTLTLRLDCGKEFWNKLGARLLIIMDQMLYNAQVCNSLIPRDHSPSNRCVLAATFSLIKEIDQINTPFTEEDWLSHNFSEEGEMEVSFYELAFSRFCSVICQLLGDKFPYVQKLIIKNLFGPSHVSSLFASDLLMFISRILHPNQKTSLCLLLLNLCKLAPPEALVKGAALVNRMNHPDLNFENPKFQYILQLQ